MVNKVCKDCVNKCKQTDKVMVITCPIKKTKDGVMGTKKGRNK